MTTIAKRFEFDAGHCGAHATIAKQFDFDAAHWLPGVARGHKCRRLHGHTYVVELKLRGKIGRTGMVVDYAEIARAWEPLHDKLDHRCLNKIRGLEHPTTEVLAYFIYARMRRSLGKLLVGVRVYESRTTYCEVP